MKEKNRVLLVVRWPVGGIRTFMRYVYQDFDAREWEFTLVAPETEELNVLLQEDLAHLGVEYVPVVKNTSAPRLAAKVASLLFSRRFDFVHSQGFTSGFCAAPSAFLRGTIHLMTSHDVVNASQFVGPKGALQKTIVGQLFRSIRVIHSVSHDAQANLLANFPAVDPARCLVIPNGIEVDRFAVAPPRNLRDELGLPGSDFLIGFMGRFMSQKGFKFLVEALEILLREKNLPGTPRILCFGWGGFIREEQAFLSQKNLTNHFRFLPFAANVASSIKGLDVVAIPSLWEACPLLPMEALACGTPIIATSCIGLREVVRDTPATVVPPRDGAALASAIKAHMETDMKAAYEQFAPEARRRFDVQNQVEGMKELYGKLIS